MHHERFNVRVYGLLERDGRVLVSHERIGDAVYAKFPGGGLEFGEGAKDAVIREFAEELGVDVSVAGHFYTTDFYLPSAFNPEDQILSLYYRVALKNEDTKLLFSDGAPSDDEVMREAQVFRWYSPKELTDGLLKLPADRVVASLIREAAEAS